MANVKLENVRKAYENGFVAVESASFEVADGEFVVLVGPSGCGKSTTLRMIAGLESVTAGTISIGDRIMNDVPASHRDIAMVFQNYALYPHMTVFQNMAFALKLRNVPRAEIDARVREAANILAIEQILERKPRQLSGGQRQRVAVGRAIVRQPKAFLFDEPLSNLDAKLRVQTRKEISRLHRRLGATMVYVTHDQVEAMTMGDRIVVMNAGMIQQIGTPIQLYEQPANLFVAGFIGSPAMNLIHGTIADGVFSTPNGALRITLPARALSGQVVLGIRPEDIYNADGPYVPPSTAGISARVDVVEPMGSEMYLYATVADLEIVSRLAPQTPPQPESIIRLAFDLTRVYFFDTASGQRAA
jgi:multiple sugar transport system ATP-binding protein